ncbi:hypothetical protein ACJX0J_009378, partial [Zea mays]
YGLILWVYERKRLDHFLFIKAYVAIINMSYTHYKQILSKFIFSETTHLYLKWKNSQHRINESQLLVSGTSAADFLEVGPCYHWKIWNKTYLLNRIPDQEIQQHDHVGQAVEALGLS